MGRKSLCCVCGRRRRLVAGGRRRRELAAGQLLVLSSVAPTQEPPLGWVWARAVYVRTRRAPGRERRARSNLLGASRRVDRGHLLTLLLAACDCEQRRNAPNRCFALLKPDGEAASWSVPRPTVVVGDRARFWIESRRDWFLSVWNGLRFSVILA
jgi:hypothetical protein